jgi:hypothetical protein
MRPNGPLNRSASFFDSVLAVDVFASLSLLKIQFGAIEGRDNQRATSPILRGPTLIAMMQAADLREGNNVIACGP